MRKAFETWINTLNLQEAGTKALTGIGLSILVLCVSSAGWAYIFLLGWMLHDGLRERKGK